MISLKILSAAAILTLALPVVDSTASYAQSGFRPGGGGGGPNVGGGGGGGPRMGGGGGGGPRFSGGGGGGPRFHGGGGGGWHRGGGGGGFIPGAIAGAVIGGAIASQSGYPGYYGNGYYGGSPYYGNSYGAYYGAPYDDGGEVVEVAPAGGGDVDYCIQTYKSYDVRSGTYLGYDGLRHACP
jgi:hypothetical protein